MPMRKISFSEPEGPNWAARAFAGPEALYKAQVMESTWGHLAPRQGVKYAGWILFAIGCFGDHAIIDTEFKRRGKVLDSSPWFYEDVYGFVGDYCFEQKDTDGKVFRFVGTYMQSEDTGDYRFDGTVSRVEI